MPNVCHAESQALAAAIRQCSICRDEPRGAPIEREPNPIVVLSSTARICIAGQAPGNLADRSGRPFTDPSGVRLRHWMGIGEEIFYDASRIAIVPMGFCFPGSDAKGGDRPPRPECRAVWHERAFAAMPQIELILAVGQHAQSWHLARLAGNQTSGRLTDAVAEWRSILNRESRHVRVLPLPHPSWRNNGWMRRHPWFAEELLPELKRLVAELL